MTILLLSTAVAILLMFVALRAFKKKQFAKMICFSSVLSLLAILIINESYNIGSFYLTNWEAKDMLAFYGSFLAFLGPTILAIITVLQTEKIYKQSIVFESKIHLYPCKNTNVKLLLPTLPKECNVDFENLESVALLMDETSNSYMDYLFQIPIGIASALNPDMLVHISKMKIVFDYNETGRYVEDTIFSNVTDKFVKVSILDKDTIELKAFLYSSVKNTDLNECLIDARFYSIDIEFEVQLNEITSKMYCKYNVEEAISDSDIQNVYKVSEGFINTNS